LDYRLGAAEPARLRGLQTTLRKGTHRQRLLHRADARRRMAGVRDLHLRFRDADGRYLEWLHGEHTSAAGPVHAGPESQLYWDRPNQWKLRDRPERHDRLQSGNRHGL